MCKSQASLKDSLNLIEQKLIHIDKYLKLAKNQSHLLESNDEEFYEGEENLYKIQNLIEEKDELIQKINSLDEEFVESFESYKDTLGDEGLDSIVNDEIFKNLQQKIKSIFDKLEMIKNIEDINNDKMQSIFKNIKKDIKEFNEETKSKMPKKMVTDLDKGFYVDEKK